MSTAAVQTLLRTAPTTFIIFLATDGHSLSLHCLPRIYSLTQPSRSSPRKLLNPRVDPLRQTDTLERTSPAPTPGLCLDSIEASATPKFLYPVHDLR